MYFTLLSITGFLLILVAFLLVFSFDSKLSVKVHRIMQFIAITLLILVFVITFILFTKPAILISENFINLNFIT
ncbi:uncharacterized membrane protein (DUF485 family) [Lactobacillus colini]|uniref:Uncharacterized membrane protein (DUF485 family) n=1 Tax=Lactobacillus colini TaxID=1819254 RepID=A0ABS4MD20_9LACO|nr:uncharacterized membrane protein (DUF485 family) [Lactobacillus colini]